MRITKLELKNFQKHEHFEADFTDKVNALYGETDCLSSDTFILYHTVSIKGVLQNCKGGTIKRLYDLFHKISAKGKGLYFRKESLNSKYKIASINDEDLVFRNDIEDVVHSGKKHLFEVVTESGFKIKASGKHRFYVGSGKYRKLQELSKGDIVYIHTNKRKKIKKKVERHKSVCVKQHPQGSLKIINKCRYYRIQKSRLVYEARLNGLTIEGYRGILNSNEDIKHLRFINSSIYEIHHNNFDRLDDRFENLSLMIKTDHKRLHREQSILNVRPKAYPDIIQEIKDVGFGDTYDIKVKNPYNNFIANNLVVHNSGKSCIVRAIKWVIYGEPKGDIVKKEGTDKTSVRITLDSGVIVERRKSTSVNAYIIYKDNEARKFDSIGKSVPDEVKNIFNMNPMIVNKEQVFLNISNQISLPFMLKDSSTFRMKVLNKLTGNDVLDEVAQSFNRDSLKFSREGKIIDEEVEAKRSSLKELSDEKNITEGLLSRVKPLVESSSKKIKKYKEASDIKRRLSVLDDNVQFNLNKMECIKYPDEKIIFRVEKIIDKFEKVKAFSQRLSSGQENLSIISDQLKSIKFPQNVKSLYKRVEMLLKVSRLTADERKKATLWSTIGEELVTVAERVEEGNIRYIQILKKYNKCPVCQSKLTDEIFKGIKL